MIAKVQVYDLDVKQLLKALDKEARATDPSKYGLPYKLDRSRLPGIVYHWLHSKQAELAKRSGAITKATSHHNGGRDDNQSRKNASNATGD